MFRNIISGIIIVLMLSIPVSAFAEDTACNAVTSENFTACCTSANPTDDQVNACRNYYSNPVSAATPTAVSTGTVLSNTGTRYQPQVALEYGSNNKFGGLSFKGVGASLVACTGLGDVVASAISTGLNYAKNAIIKGVSKIPLVGGFIGGLFGGPDKGSSASNPLYVKDNGLQNKAACLDGIAYVLSQQVLQQITNRTLHWANTGFGGNPLYVRNIDSYLYSIRNDNLNRFLGTSAQGLDPIFGNALRSVITQQVTGITDGYINTALNTPQAKAYNSFQNDFTSGGWGALLNPANNPIGAFFNSVNKLDNKISSDQQNTQAELTRNSGYFDMKTCVQFEQLSPQSTEEAINLGLSTQPKCLKYETVTPGSLVASQVSNITNSPTRQAELATHFNEAVGSFFDAMLNQLFSRGLSSIKGTANSADIGLSTGGPGTNAVLGTNGQFLAGVNDNVGSINDIAAAGATIDISRPQLIRGVLKKQYDYLSKTSDNRAIIDRILPEIAQLDYCLPGPNPSWKNGLDKNFQTFLSTVFPIQIAFSNHISFNKGANNAVLDDKTNGGSIRLFPSDADETTPITITLQNTNIGFKVRQYLLDTYNDMIKELDQKFSRQAIGDAFASTKSTVLEQDYARGMATDSYDEVSNLPGLAISVVAADEDYDSKIATSKQDIQDLEAIHRQASAIVAKAKARYIAEQRAAGTPVNQQCIDAAYSIDTSPIIPIARNESDTPSPLIQRMLDANRYFYSLTE